VFFCLAETRYLYFDGETVAGTVNVHLKKPGQKLEHQGIKIEFIGAIGLLFTAFILI
jgi:vacuolar protein sorting-associated protein 26